MKLTKRTVDALEANGRRFFAWDDALPGFGVRVEGSGRRTFICRYRSNGVRRQFTIGRYGTITVDEARSEARRILGNAVLGRDLAGQRNDQRRAIRLSELIDAFLEGHGPKLKPRSRLDYENALRKHLIPAVGHMPAEAITANDLNRVHLKLGDRPFRANRTMAYLGSVYSWAAKNGYVPKDCNPSTVVRRFREEGREQYLTGDQLERLGTILRQAETVGLPWKVTAMGDRRKHLPKTVQAVVYPAHTTAAIRLLLFTGCRLSEVLNLRWEQVDLERGLLLLPDSKTGRKSIILNGPAVAELTALERIGAYVIVGNTANRPRRDLKRPWHHIRSAADLDGVRLHDLRHTYASIGAGAGFGLQIVGRLLGQKSPLTTQRYAHLADDPVRRASEAIGKHLSRAMEPYVGD